MGAEGGELVRGQGGEVRERCAGREKVGKGGCFFALLGAGLIEGLEEVLDEGGGVLVLGTRGERSD